MFYINKEKEVRDSEGKVVGFVKDNKFSQYRLKEGHFSKEPCNQAYVGGLNPLELEQISELMQRTR